MIRTQLYLPEELYAQAKLRAQLEGVTISQLVREGLFAVLANKKAKKKSPKKQGPLDHLVGKFTFGDGSPTNAALTHNDIYDL